MKKLLSYILSVIMVLSLFAGCETKSAHSLQVGYGRADITPDCPVPLGGYTTPSPLERTTSKVTHRLYATCIAITDETDNTILLFHIDLIKCYDVLLFGRSDVAKATGVPYSQIMVATTHNHSSPQLDMDWSSGQDEYIALLRAQMVAAAQGAMSDRKEAQVYTNTVYPESLNFVRHYNCEDGTVSGDGFGTGSKKISHVSEADNAMQLIKFIREGGKDILLVNWQSHPHFESYYNKYVISSDIVGSMREILESEMDCHFAYFTGASGNINAHTYIKEERIADDSETHSRALSDYILNAGAYTRQEAGAVQCLTQSVSLDLSTSSGKMDIPVSVYSFGDVAFAAVPYEMFDTNGLEVKNGSPFAMTFISTCTNAAFGYIPSNATYDYQQYDVYELRKCQFYQGAAETLSQIYVSMLKSIYDTRK